MSFNDWPETIFVELIESVSETQKYRIEKMVLINTSDVYDGKVLNHKYVDTNDIPGQFKKKFQYGDILYSEIRPANKRYAFVDFDSRDYIASTKLMVLRNKNALVNNRFLFHVLKSSNVINELQTIAESRSGTFPQITFSELARLKIKLPKLSEQIKIAQMLDDIDYKIELNNNINKTLEEMAQAVFKSWFVDFEPFKDGEYVKSELGSIPAGWRIDSLTGLAEFLNGLAMQKYRPKSEEYLPVIKIRELNQGFADESCDKAAVDIPGKYIIDDGDIIFSWSGTLLLKLWVGGKGGLNQHLFRVTPYDFPKWFVYFWIQYHMPFFKLISSSKATTMGHINRNHLEESKVIIPSKELITKADLVIGPIFKQIINLSIENRKLIDLRDSLIPKLMSGEIPVTFEEVSHANVR